MKNIQIQLLRIHKAFKPAVQRQVVEFQFPIPSFVQFATVDPTTTFSIPNAAAVPAVLASLAISRPDTTGFLNPDGKSFTVRVALLPTDSPQCRIDDQTTGKSYTTTGDTTGRVLGPAVTVWTDYDFWVESPYPFHPVCIVRDINFTYGDGFNVRALTGQNQLFRQDNPAGIDFLFKDFPKQFFMPSAPFPGPGASTSYAMHGFAGYAYLAPDFFLSSGRSAMIPRNTNSLVDIYWVVAAQWLPDGLGEGTKRA